jgi:putative phosphoribosyl transferase
MLALELEHLVGQDIVVVGLPRGGVPVAFEVARALNAPLDALVVRKLGVPSQSELGMGAIGEGGVRVLNADIVSAAGVSEREIELVAERELVELTRRADLYRQGRPLVVLKEKTVIIVDDGIATGGSARAAVEVVRAHRPHRVVLAVPVGAAATLDELGDIADEVIALLVPDNLYGIGYWYEDFEQTTDQQVADLLGAATAADSSGASSAPRVIVVHAVDKEVAIRVGPVDLGGHWSVPAKATGLVLFVHGSGSSRHSTRNQYVASELNRAGLGTLLFDLLSPIEETNRANAFDIDLLAARLLAVTDWVRTQPGGHLPLGYFGASTGAAAALAAAADPDSSVRAIVSRGGRPDLAGDRLYGVRAPTLLVVGGDDQLVLRLNQDAAERLRCTHRIEIVPRAGHLFEEPGTLEQVAHLAADWFMQYLI